MISLFNKGLATGFSIAAPVGVIGFLCIQQTLKGGIRLGLASGLGAATADMMYGILVALGLQVTQQILLAYKFHLTLFGGLFLCYLGLKKIVSTPPTAFDETKKSEQQLPYAYATTFLLTLTNPATILDFIALFAGLNISTSGWHDSFLFIFGVFIGSALWWLLLCFSVGLFRKKVSATLLRWINYSAGTIIFFFGIYALFTIY